MCTLEGSMVSPKPKYMETHKNGQNFADNIFECTSFYFYENYSAWITISPKFIIKSQIDNRPTLVQAMAWCETGNKPLPDPMVIEFPDIYMCHLILIARLTIW